MNSSIENNTFVNNLLVGKWSLMNQKSLFDKDGNVVKSDLKTMVLCRYESFSKDLRGKESLLSLTDSLERDLELLKHKMIRSNFKSNHGAHLD